MRFRTRLSSSLAIALLAATAASANGLGALCDASTPCDDGLTCRDGFCLRIEAPPKTPAPEDPPSALEPKPAEEPTLDPNVDGAEVDAAVDGAEVDPQVNAAEVDPEVDGATVDPQVDGATIDSTEPRGPGATSKADAPKGEAPKGETPKGEMPKGDAPKPEERPPPGAALDGKTAAARATLAEDASGQVWGAAGGRAIATPALVCGGCLLGAGACTAFGGWQFVSDADAGRFDDFPESTRNATIGGFIGLGVGAVASLLGAPLVLVGEGASVYGAFLDVALCGSGLGLGDGLLIALGGGHGIAWTLAPQLLGVGAALLGSGAWVWIAANGVNAYPETDSGARAILHGYEGAALGMMAASTVPLGLGCLLGLAGIGVDFGAVLRAGALREEALAEAPTATRPNEALDERTTFAAVAARGATIAY